MVRQDQIKKPDKKLINTTGDPIKGQSDGDTKLTDKSQ